MFIIEMSACLSFQRSSDSVNSDKVCSAGDKFWNGTDNYDSFALFKVCMRKDVFIDFLQ